MTLSRSVTSRMHSWRKASSLSQGASSLSVGPLPSSSAIAQVYHARCRRGDWKLTEKVRPGLGTPPDASQKNNPTRRPYGTTSGEEVMYMDIAHDASGSP